MTDKHTKAEEKAEAAAEAKAEKAEAAAEAKQEAAYEKYEKAQEVFEKKHPGEIHEDAYAKYEKEFDKVEEKVAEVIETVVKKLKFISHYSFYDTDGTHKAWAEGDVVTDPAEIKMLEGRGAPVEKVDE